MYIYRVIHDNWKLFAFHKCIRRLHLVFAILSRVGYAVTFNQITWKITQLAQSDLSVFIFHHCLYSSPTLSVLSLFQSFFVFFYSLRLIDNFYSFNGNNMRATIKLIELRMASIEIAEKCFRWWEMILLDGAVGLSIYGTSAAETAANKFMGE